MLEKGEGPIKNK